MKKITLSILAVVSVGVLAYGQSLDVSSVSPSNQSPNGGEDIVFDQPVTGTQGIISDYDTVGNLVVSADDFVLTESTRIDKITSYGFNNDLSLPSTFQGLKLFIFADAAGSPDGSPTNPAGAILALDLLDGDPGLSYVDVGGGGFDMVVDITDANGGTEVVLDAGTYWLAVAPVLNVVDITLGASRWNWYQYDLGGNALLIDPNDLFGAGATTWTSMSDLTAGAIDSVAFTIEGEADIISVEDQLLSQVSVSPNPATDFISINVPNGVEINNATVYDILGKDTGVTLVNGQLNVSQLQKGIYLLSINTNQGTLTQKVVKR